MYANQLEEHIAHSATCNSRWDGFDRGTVWADEQYVTERVIGRMTSEAGKRVVISEASFSDGGEHYTVSINGGNPVFDSWDKQQAIAVARWWMDGCPA